MGSPSLSHGEKENRWPRKRNAKIKNRRGPAEWLRCIRQSEQWIKKARAIHGPSKYIDTISHGVLSYHSLHFVFKRGIICPIELRIKRMYSFMESIIKIPVSVFIIIVLMFCFAISVSAEPNVLFRDIKAMVQANGTPEKNGNVALRIDVTNESGTIKYMIGYVNGKQIGAVKMVGPQMFLVVFDESDNQYIASIWVGEQCLMERIITEQEAVEWAKTVFIHFTGKPING